jgi:hypothetical protein
MSDRYNDMIAFAQVQQKVARGENLYWNNSYEINNLRRSPNATNALSNKIAEVQTLFQLGVIRSLYTSNLQLGNISNQLGDLSIQLGKNHLEVMSGFNNLASILRSNQLQTNALFRQLIYAVDHQRDFGRVKLGNYKIQELLLEDGNVFLSSDDDIKYCLVDKYGEKLIAYKKIALMESRGQNPWNSRDEGVVSIINLLNAANPPNPDQLQLLNSLYPNLTFRNTRQEKIDKEAAILAESIAKEKYRLEKERIAKQREVELKEYQEKKLREEEKALLITWGTIIGIVLLITICCLAIPGFGPGLVGLFFFVLVFGMIASVLSGGP